MSKPVGFGIIGAGNIAAFHARAIEQVDSVQLVATHSVPIEQGQAFASQYGCEFESTLESFLARPDIEAVAIGTPSGTHAELCIAAANASKHILCEKPLDITVEKIDAILEAVDRNNVILGAIFQSRFSEGARITRQAVEAGRFGNITQCGAYIPWFRSNEYYASAGWRGTWELDGGGALMNQGIHAIDLMLWLAGDVAQVSARCKTLLRPIEVEDNAVAWLDFKNGAVGVIQGSTTCYPGESKRVEIKGDKGSVTLVDDVPVLWQFEDEQPEDAEIRAKASGGDTARGAADPKSIGVQGHILQYQDFAGAIREGRDPAVPGREGRRAVALIRAIYESSQTNQIVTL